MSVVSRCAGRLSVSVSALALVVMMLCGRPAVADARTAEHVVAVLYFDNNTGDAEYDVFQKGLADMMITDLTTVKNIKVVERDKLQALLDEVSLQQTKYFDKKTAVKLGKGLGARYAITGAIHALKPTLRIDVRMIDISTGEVVVTSKVSGQESEIFELEQKLVASFVEGMDQRFSPSVRPHTRVPDVDTLLDYAKAVDLADKGLYEDASTSMQQVVRSAPAFALARVKRQQFIKRLEAAGARRSALMGELGADLAKKIEQHLEHNDINKLDQKDAKVYLAYRALRGRFIMAALDKQVANARGYRVILEGRKAKATLLMEAYHANAVLFLREFDAYAARHTQTLPDGTVYLDTYLSLPKDDERSAKAAGMDVGVPRSAVAMSMQLGEFLLLGRYEDLGGKPHNVAPPLAELDAEYKKLGYHHLHEAFVRADVVAKTYEYGVNEAINALDTHAEALFLRDQDEQGLAKLQEILDRYPTSRQFKRYEKKIQQRLGLAHDHEVGLRESYVEGLRDCKDMDLRKGMDSAFRRHVRLRGLAGVHEVVAEVEKACQGKPKLEHLWPYLYIRAALIGAEQENCKIFDDYVARYLAAGGSVSDSQGYRKNYSKCPAP